MVYLMRQRTIVPAEHPDTDLIPSSTSPYELLPCNPFVLVWLESLSSMNIEMPTLTRPTTTYLYGLNLRRYNTTFRRRTGMSLHD